MTKPPIILVPGYWLGAWAWDEVAALLRAEGHEVTALTLPGLESVDSDRSMVTFADHVHAISDAVTAAGRPVVLAVHSGSGTPGYAVTDLVPENIAAMVYVDTGPGKGDPHADVSVDDLPMPPADELAANENLDGLSQDQLDEFRRRAVPEPGAVASGGAALVNDARLDVPSTVIATGFSSDGYKEAVKEGYAFLAGLTELRDVTWVDLPTSHWPMWSRPQELAAILSGIANAAGSD